MSRVQAPIFSGRQRTFADFCSWNQAEPSLTFERPALKLSLRIEILSIWNLDEVIAVTITKLLYYYITIVLYYYISSTITISAQKSVQDVLNDHPLCFLAHLAPLWEEAEGHGCRRTEKRDHLPASGKFRPGTE